MLTEFCLHAQWHPACTLEFHNHHPLTDRLCHCQRAQLCQCSGKHFKSRWVLGENVGKLQSHFRDLFDDIVKKYDPEESLLLGGCPDHSIILCASTGQRPVRPLFRPNGGVCSGASSTVAAEVWAAVDAGWLLLTAAWVSPSAMQPAPLCCSLNGTAQPTVRR